MSQRQASIKRKTNETDIELNLNIDGTGICEIETGMPFFEHMLEQICRHGQIDLKIQAKGDLEVDAHHTVEDIGICFGQAFDKAIGGKEGINRYGHAYGKFLEKIDQIFQKLCKIFEKNHKILQNFVKFCKFFQR